MIGYVTGLSGLSWRVGGIEPTYALDDARGWLIDGRIEIETDDAVPVAAWAEMVDRKSRAGRVLLITYHLTAHGGHGRFRVWKLARPRPESRMIGADLGILTRRYVTHADYPPSPTAAPALLELYAAANERMLTLENEDRQRRAADPLIDVLDQVCDRVDIWEIDTTRTDIHTILNTLPRADVEELLIRLAIAYAELSNHAYRQHDDDA